MRRLRSAFSLFAPAVQDNKFLAIRDELRWFASAFGEARNLDVLASRLEEQLTPTTQAYLLDARSSAYDELETVLGSQRSRFFMLDLVDWVEFGQWRSSEPARSPIKKLARRRLDARWRRVQRDGAALDQVSEETRHRVRIDIKKLRYASEFMWSLYEKNDRARRKFASELSKMQENLGYLNDISTASELITSLPELRQLPPSPDPAEARKHLRRAQRSYDRLTATGPYWR
jgi:CHAD domain-containing protein